MNLITLAEPIFQYICRLNRLGRCAGGGGQAETPFCARSPSAPEGVSEDFAVVRAQV
jgi:hypothetical protein